MTAQHHRETIRTGCSLWARGARALIACVLLLVIGLATGEAALADTTQSEEVRVIGRLPLQLTPLERSDFEQRTLNLAKITRAKDAVTSYSCNADIEHPGTYVFDEIWPSGQALRDHLATEHFKAWWDWVEPHLSGDLVISVAPTADFRNLS